MVVLEIAQAVIRRLKKTYLIFVISSSDNKVDLPHCDMKGLGDNVSVNAIFSLQNFLYLNSHPGQFLV